MTDLIDRVSEEERAFVRTIRASPADDAPRLVYADWLDEHDQPERAQLLREHCRAYRLPARHPGRDRFALYLLVAAAQVNGEWLPDGVVVRGWGHSLDLLIGQPYGSTFGRWIVRRGLVEMYDGPLLLWARDADRWLAAHPVRYARVTAPRRRLRFEELADGRYRCRLAGPAFDGLPPVLAAWDEPEGRAVARFLKRRWPTVRFRVD